MTPILDHPLRYKLANELHARPFPAIQAPCHAAYLAITRDAEAEVGQVDAERRHLLQLLDRFGAPHPAPGATHYFGEIGKLFLKWEQHTEFVTYTLFGEGVADRPFDGTTFGLFPQEWLSVAPGQRLSSALFRIEINQNEEDIRAKLRKWFVSESLAVNVTNSGKVIVAGDFRIDPAGHTRFAAFVAPETRAHEIGQVIQRACEIETYKAIAMQGFSMVRELRDDLSRIDGRLNELALEMANDEVPADKTLAELLQLSAELEHLMAQSSFRFAGTAAYSSIVWDRVKVMTDNRFAERQTFSEFMIRRFEPAMRTVKSTETRLSNMSQRARRVAELLRTRVDVERSAQNQKLLESMNRRADLQLRLQKTVEGLSVVAISYYALNLAGYFLMPAAKSAGLDKASLMAALVPVVVVSVWWVVRKIRNSVH